MRKLRAMAVSAGLVLAVQAGAAPVDGGRGDAPPVPDAAEELSRMASTFLSPGKAGQSIRASRDIIIDNRRRAILVLQRLIAEQPTPATPPAIPPKTVGPSATYTYKREKVINVIRELAKEAGMNMIIRGPVPAETMDVEFKNVPTRDLLKLILDIYNFHYQMSPKGETLVVFTGPVHRTLESYAIPAKVPVPLEEIAQAIQTAVLDVDEPAGPPLAEEEEPAPQGVPEPPVLTPVTSTPPTTPTTAGR